MKLAHASWSLVGLPPSLEIISVRRRNFFDRAIGFPDSRLALPLSLQVGQELLPCIQQRQSPSRACKFSSFCSEFASQVFDVDWLTASPSLSDTPAIFKSHLCLDKIFVCVKTQHLRRTLGLCAATILSMHRDFCTSRCV